jgi:uncharacterized protein (DUF1697 family)
MPATAYAALLRAVNVGGTGKLAMTDLARLCEKTGFCDVKTYIQSGNVVFTCAGKEPAVKKAIEQALTKHMGKPVAVMIRTAEELEAAIAANPFPKAEPNRLLVTFFDEALPKGAVDGLEGPDGERLAVRGRELFVHYPNGMGSSKLKVPAGLKLGTGRNLNTVAKLAAMARALQA